MAEANEVVSKAAIRHDKRMKFSRAIRLNLENTLGQRPGVSSEIGSFAQNDYLSQSALAKRQANGNILSDLQGVFPYENLKIVNGGVSKRGNEEDF